MYDFSLVFGSAFCLYVTLLVFVAMKMRNNNRKETAGKSATRRFAPRVKEQEDPISDIHISDENGKTIITWTPPVNENYVATKVYLRVSNNPVAAVSRYEILRSDNTSESITHNRNGSRFWYWITLVYADGSESEKQFVDVMPNSDD